MATDITDLESLRAYAKEHGLVIPDQQPQEAAERIMVPYQWTWDVIEPAVSGTAKHIRLAENFEDAGGAVRRLTIMDNPKNSPGARVPLRLNVQCVLPGEQALSHRHSPGATRFVIKGSKDAFTLVNGEPFPLEDGDFITTPHLTWHGHVNNSDDYVLWLDGLDSPFTALGARFGEEWPDAKETVDYRREGESAQLRAAHLQPPARQPIDHPDGPDVKHDGAAHPPAFRYSWKDTQLALKTMSVGEFGRDPFDCYSVLYADPITGGPTFPTTANEMALLSPGFVGREHRHNNTVIYYAFQGNGVLIAGGERFEWSAGDFIELPPWTTHRHENPTSEDAFLYSFTDWPAQKALGQYYYQEF